MGRCEIEWSLDGFLLDLSPVESLLARFPSGLEAAALKAIFALCRRSLAEFNHIDPGTGRLTISREAQFLITSLRRSDSLTIYNIQVDWLGTRPEAEAYVLFRDGNTILRKEPRPGTDAPISQHTYFEEARANRVRAVPRVALHFARHAFGCEPATPTARLSASSVKAGALGAPVAAAIHLPTDARSASTCAAVIEFNGLIERSDREGSRLALAFAASFDSGPAAGTHRGSQYYCYAFTAEAEFRMLEEGLWLASALRSVPSKIAQHSRAMHRKER